MSDIFCDKRGKEVTIITSGINAGALQDKVPVLIAGRISCVEEQSGRCSVEDDCPLLKHK